ncbi:MAG: zf-HC2 domain-containing protein [Holophagaceae bacterium]|nr:zf-HC2 domain-containing protein [Holophagaceae bacterium]
MSTLHVTEKLALWAGGDLSEQEMISIQEHLEICPECRLEAHAYSEAMSLLQAPIELPFSTEDQVVTRNSVMAKIRSEKTTRKSQIQRFIPLLVAVASIPICILLYSNAKEKIGQKPPIANSQTQTNNTVATKEHDSDVKKEQETKTVFEKVPIKPSTRNTSIYRAAKDQPQSFWPDPTITRIEIQTEDPNYKIILVPPTSQIIQTTTEPLGDTNEQSS